MKATMVEVAALAGVSTATVSHVVNWTRVVEPATRARVEQAIAAVGYRPNQVARSLKTSSTRTLGLAMSMLRNPYFAELAQAIEGHAARAGFMLVIADTRESAEHETLVLDQLLARQVDGIILATSSTSLPLLDLRVPIVLVDRTLDVDCDQVGPENFHSTAQLTGHLADHGRRRIAMMAGMAGISTTDERVARVPARAGIQRFEVKFCTVGQRSVAVRNRQRRPSGHSSQRLSRLTPSSPVTTR